MLKVVSLFFKTLSPYFTKLSLLLRKTWQEWGGVSGVGVPTMRSPVTFKMKLYVTTVNNSFQPLTIFSHKELHLRCHIGPELNIVT